MSALPYKKITQMHFIVTKNQIECLSVLILPLKNLNDKPCLCKHTIHDG